jgi:hypothetical protein
MVNTITNLDENQSGPSSTQEEVTDESSLKPSTCPVSKPEPQVPTGMLVDLGEECTPGSTNTTSTDVHSAAPGSSSQTVNPSDAPHGGLGSEDGQGDNASPESDSEESGGTNVAPKLDLTLPSIPSLFDDMSHWLLPEGLSGDNAQRATADEPVPNRTTSNRGQSENDNVCSPVRTLFPSTSRSWDAERRAELRRLNQELQQECDDWKKRYNEVLKEREELKETNRSLQESIEMYRALYGHWESI